MNADRVLSENISNQIKVELEKKGIELVGKNTQFWSGVGLEDVTPD